MSIVILVGGSSEQGNAEHRYLVGRFLEHYGDKVTRIITARPVARPIHTRLKRMIKRGDYRERLARALYTGGYGPKESDVQRLLLPDESDPVMPGKDRVTVVSSHNDAACHALIASARPDVVAVYGTAILKAPLFTLSRKTTLNLHTGLSPYYRGDSTLFWPVHDNDPEHLGVTVHRLVASVDGGDIAATAPVPYSPGDTEAHLFSKGVKIGTQLYLEVVEKALNGELDYNAQDLSLGREFSWRDRTVAAEHQVLSQLSLWNTLAQTDHQ